jgi:hypothetical protein
MHLLALAQESDMSLTFVAWLGFGLDSTVQTVGLACAEAT